MIAATRQIKETLELSTFQHYRCAAHILNLVVSAALEIHIIPQSVKKLRNFISTVRNSPKQMDKLKEYFRVEDIDFKTPLPDIVISYPTIGEVKWLFFGIKNHLEKSRNDDYKLQAQINEMKRVFNNYFGQFNKSLHIPAFFDPRYKKSSYGNMSREEVFQPIQELMANYQELTTPVSQTTTVRRRLA
ncbi:8101_t:CDS:2, partial [Rhizophagus irregularis]